MKWHGSGLSDIGQHRDTNEDRYIVDNKNNIYIVADGMGGVDGGEVAAQIIIDELPKLINSLTEEHSDISGKEFHTAIQQQINIVNDLIYHQGVELGLYEMGSTLVGVIIQDSIAVIFHVGDSRCYQHSNEELNLLTKDHNCPTDSYQLTRALGEKDGVQSDIKRINLSKGDKLLLCSDGLNHMLSDEDITEVVSSNSSSNIICKNLIKKANESGGEDNITTIIISLKK